MVSVQSVLTVDPGLNPTPENINRISLIPQAKENDFNDQIVKKTKMICQKVLRHYSLND